MAVKAHAVPSLCSAGVGAVRLKGEYATEQDPSPLSDTTYVLFDSIGAI